MEVCVIIPGTSLREIGETLFGLDLAQRAKERDAVAEARKDLLDAQQRLARLTKPIAREGTDDQD